MPSGGAQDKESPKVLHAQPNFGEVNYRGEDFILEFDEYIRPNQLNAELIVSPPLSDDSEPEIKGKKLIIPFLRILDSNTTYTISLRNGIVDLNEGNPLDSNLWVFSTGPELDSGYIKGQIIDAFSQEALSEMWIMLYNENTDSLPYKEQATYLSQSDKAGYFEFEFLPENQNFKLFALKDENADYLFSLPTEQIAFTNEMVVSATDSLRLKAFVEYIPLTYISEYRQIDQDFISLKFSQSIRSIQLEGIDFELKSSFDEIRSPVDSLIIELDYSESTDSLRFNVVIDSLNSDTLFLLNQPDSGRSYLKASIPSFISTATALIPKINRRVIWNEQAKVSLLGADSIEISGKDGIFELPDSLSGSYELIIPDSSYCTAQGQCNDSLAYKVFLLDSADAPDLIVKPSEVKNAVLELLNDKGELLMQDSKAPFYFKNLQPAKYQLRLYLDENQNGFWDTGDYLKSQQAETIFRYKGEVDLKKGFDLELDWELSP